jgi:hypothetical protein
MNNIPYCYKTNGKEKIDKIRKVIVPNTIISRSQTINILVNKEEKRLNGKAEK